MSICGIFVSMIDYKKLDVWTKGLEILKLVYIFSAKFPEEEKFGLTSQIRRAAISLISNIAEGAGRNSNAQFVSFLSYSKGSASEIEAQSIAANILGYLDGKTLEEISNHIDHYSRMNQKLQDYFKNKI